MGGLLAFERFPIAAGAAHGHDPWAGRGALAASALAGTGPRVTPAGSVGGRGSTAGVSRDAAHHSGHSRASGNLRYLFSPEEAGEQRSFYRGARGSTGATRA